MTMRSPSLSGILVVNTGLNLPAPATARRLVDLGASAIKVEPPGGDPFAVFCPDWYAAMHEGVERRSIDLKTIPGQEAMAALLEGASVLVTSQRPGALKRMGLDAADLRERLPRLCIVNIVGAPGAEAQAPGHDLTYQARAGLLAPPHLPRTLLADLAGAQEAVIAVLALLAAGGGIAEVALSTAAAYFQAPLIYGLTRPGGYLGGGHAGYQLYATTDGWISLAALEPTFWLRLREHLPEGVPVSPFPIEAQEVLRGLFGRHTTAHWLAWSRQYDIPLEPVVDLT
jgi:crotonobetainyl-CoA:carnitine CoA-transferase CaiB-like acyl-CoA transferase